MASSPPTAKRISSGEAIGLKLLQSVREIEVVRAALACSRGLTLR